LTFKNRLMPVVKNSGFKMEGYYVWCGSAIKGDNGKYYLFAARWPKSTSFPDGYMISSEIVLAMTDDLSKPFQFVKVIIGSRGKGYWDGMMAHNPFITKNGDEYVLFYIGTPDGSGEKRAIGYAHSKNLENGWIRSDSPIRLPANANNPSVLVMDNGDLLLYYRDGKLKVSVARANCYDGEFKVLKYDLFPMGMIEDMFVFKNGDHYEMLAEDAGGKYTGLAKSGVHFISKDAINWEPAEPVMAYDFEVEYEDGSKISLQRRERPVLLFDNDTTYLFTAAKYGGDERLTGGNTWNIVQRLKL